MQDMEFTIENGKLYMLQTRNGKRTAAAALKIAVDLVDEGMITKEEAILKVEPKQLDALLHPQFRRRGAEGSQARGTGPARFSRRCLRQSVLHGRRCARLLAERGEKVVLVPPGNLS